MSTSTTAFAHEAEEAEVNAAGFFLGPRATYGIVALALFVAGLVMLGHVAMARVGDGSGAALPLVLRAVGVSIAMGAGVLKIASYLGRRDTSFLILGVSLLGVGVIESARLVVLVVAQAVTDTVPLIEAAGRLGWAAGTSLPLFLLIGMVLLPPTGPGQRRERRGAFLLAAGLVAGLGASAPLLPAFPGGVGPGSVVARPDVSWAVSIYLVTLVLLWHRPDVSATVDGRWLMFALYVGFLDQTLVAPFWSGFGTGPAAVDASLKLATYALAGTGVLMRMTAIAHEQAQSVDRYRREAEERARTEDALARQAARLALANEELEEYAYLASHDLQEPLRMVTNYLQLIERRYGDRLDEDGHEFVRFAVDGAVRMKTLIHDLLAYSTVSADEQGDAPADAGEAFDAAVKNLEVAIDEAGAEVERTELPVVAMDSLQLMQVFQNLIGNALKFRQPDATPRIQAAVRRLRDAWEFSLRDNGIGIDPKYGERVFKVFQRLHQRDAFPGSGIGLAMCRKIVTRHGGNIWFESAPGEGTTFYWTVPTRLTRRPQPRDAGAATTQDDVDRRVSDMIERVRELI